MLNCGGFCCLVIEQSLEVASDYPRRAQVVGGFAHWPVNLELDGSGPGWVLGLCHLSDKLDGAWKTGWNVS